MSKQKLSLRGYAKAIFQSAVMSAKIAPWAVTAKAFGTIINALLPLATIYLSAQTTTELVAAFNGNMQARDTVIVYIILTALAGFITAVWSSIDRYIQALMRYVVEGKVSTIMYEHFLQLEFWRYDDKDTIDTYQKAQEFGRFYAYVFDRLSSVATHAVTTVSAIIALVLFSPWIGLMVVIALIPGIVLQFKLSRAKVAHWNTNVDARRSQSYIEWNLLQPSVITELKLNNLVNHLLNLRNTFRDKDQKDRMKFEKRYLGWQILSDGIEVLASLVATVWTAWEIIAKISPLGQFIFVQMTVSRALSGANNFITNLSQMDEELAQLYDYLKFISYPRADNTGDILIAQPKTISFNGVSFSYHGSKELVLKNITLSISKGQHVAIVGENGAGKSTFVKLLLGLYEPRSGSVTLDHINLSNYQSSSWHNFIAVLQQDFINYGFADVKSNILFGNITKKFEKADYNNALLEAEAEQFINNLPRGDKTLTMPWMEDNEGNKGINLSGGQWQRIALARSFYRGSPIIILDEPTSAIDALAESRIFRRLFSEKDKTIITVSHRLTTVSKADIIYVFENGEVVESGTHKELVDKKGYYVRLFESQLN